MPDYKGERNSVPVGMGTGLYDVIGAWGKWEISGRVALGGVAPHSPTTHLAASLPRLASLAGSAGRSRLPRSVRPRPSGARPAAAAAAAARPHLSLFLPG